MTTTYELAENYCKMRDKAVIQTVRTGDTKYIQHLFRYLHMPIPSEKVMMCTACKCACNILYMPKDVVKKAEKWLYANGYSPEIGED